MRIVNIREREKVTYSWRKLHEEQYCNLYSLPYIIQVIESMSMKLAMQVALTGSEEFM
jgi:hypothetical protein